MYKTKTEKGITLIALIITIIILLILAVVTIGSMKDDGTIGYSQKASNEYVKAEEKEKITLALSEYKIAKYAKDDAKLEIEGATITGSAELGYNISFDKTNNRYSVDSNGNIVQIEDVEVPKATLNGRYEFDTRTVGNYSLKEFIHHNISANDKELNGSTTPQIPAKLTYKDGSTENVIFCYSGKIDNGYDGVETDYWSCYIEGTPILNDDGTYTWQNGSNGYMELESYTSTIGDGTMTSSDENTHLLWIYDGFESSSETKLIDLVRIEILGEIIDNEMYYWLLGNIEKGDTDLFKNINNIKRVIVNFPDAPQRIGTKFTYENDGYVGFAVGDENDKVVCLYLE